MRKTALLLIGAFMAAVVTAPVAVLASHSFVDVPTTNPFHNDIDWLQNAGVTKGCSTTEYCPSDFVTREQMAAFLHRLAVNQVVDAEELEGLTAVQVVSQCPTGTDLFVSACIESSPRPPADWLVAAQTCAADGRRLPAPGELLGYREQPGVTLGAEWTDDIADSSAGFVIYIATDVGTGTLEDPFQPLQYRCVAGLGS